MKQRYTQVDSEALVTITCYTPRYPTVTRRLWIDVDNDTTDSATLN